MLLRTRLYLLCLQPIIYFQFALLRIIDIKDILQDIFVLLQRYRGNNTFIFFLVLEHSFATLVHLIEGVALKIYMNGQKSIWLRILSCKLGTKRRLTLLIAAHCLARVGLALLLGDLLRDDLLRLDSIPVIPRVLRKQTSERV